MNELTLYRAIGEIDDDLINEANTFRFRRISHLMFSIPAIAAAAVVIVLIFCFGAANKTVHISSNNSVTIDTENYSDLESKSSAFYYELFHASANHDFVAYGDDEIEWVEVMIGNYVYHQIDKQDLGNYKILENITENCFGEYIGTITEIFPDETADGSVLSKEPSLAGADVFYYAPSNSKAVLIVRKDDMCSFFTISNQLTVSDNEYMSFEECFNFYGAASADDIESISYSIFVPNSDMSMTAVSQGVITDINKINEITKLFFELEPQTAYDLAPYSGTAQWYIDRWETYKQDPELYNREDISIEIRFKNGTLLEDILYQPFLGNGSVTGMHELSEEQNKKLRKIFE